VRNTSDVSIRVEDCSIDNVSRFFARLQVTKPLVDWYGKKGVLKTFEGTMSDVIYPQVKAWLEAKGY
jgi:hypothetical protein